MSIPYRKSHLYSRLRQVICAGRGTRKNIGPKNQKMLDSGPPLNENKRISAMLWSQVPCSGVKCHALESKDATDTTMFCSSDSYTPKNTTNQSRARGRIAVFFTRPRVTLGKPARQNVYQSVACARSNRGFFYAPARHSRQAGTSKRLSVPEVPSRNN
jgi:hypothetical protein